ncbi:MAG: pyridoxamine 5'-phosphate oxidase [Candidatus Omnitrophica bacterium]|nr:pyridoxamine 5'-phosphate oxidase [Candidatus Omnitrophota bacterium]
MDLYAEALSRLNKLLEQAKSTSLLEPASFSLATADSAGRPSVRTVLVKGIDERGLVFYTNLNSRKARQIADNPNVALCFHWDPICEQVLIEGKVEAVSDAEADAYWKSRPRESQIGAWASLQSKPLKTRALLLARVAKYSLKHIGSEIPRPPHWSGLRVKPVRFEFWSSKPARLHERILYEKREGQWHRSLLYP